MGKIDFDMWFQKIKATLMQMRCVKALEDSWPVDMIPTRKFELEEVAWSTIFSYLCEHVIKAVGETKTTSKFWTKL